jgi:hypothetical protein
MQARALADVDRGSVLVNSWLARRYYVGDRDGKLEGSIRRNGDPSGSGG